MTYPIYNCSPQAKKRIKTSKDQYGTSVNSHPCSKYPFEELAIGKCFTVSIAEVKVPSMRVLVSQKNSANKKQFCTVIHRDSNELEIARIA